MNVLKNMEAIFLAAAVLASATAYASDAIPAARAAHNAQISVEGDRKIAVVRITAKRPDADEKAQSV